MKIDNIGFSCPSCSSHIMLEGPLSATIVCKTCSSKFLLKEHLCPNCLTFTAESKGACAACGSVLSQRCSLCSLSNWSGHASCLNCGNSLDMLSIITGRYSPDSTTRRLETQRHMAKAIKAIEEISSQKRMRELEEIERKRKHLLDQRQNDRQRSERLMLIVSGMVLAAFILILFIYALLQLSG